MTAEIDLLSATLRDIVQALDDRRINSVQLVQAYLGEPCVINLLLQTQRDKSASKRTMYRDWS